MEEQLLLTEEKAYILLLKHFCLPQKRPPLDWSKAIQLHLAKGDAHCWPRFVSDCTCFGPRSS